MQQQFPAPSVSFHLVTTTGFLCQLFAGDAFQESSTRQSQQRDQRKGPPSSLEEEKDSATIRVKSSFDKSGTKFQSSRKPETRTYSNRSQRSGRRTYVSSSQSSTSGK